MATQAEKGMRFRALHGREGAFVIPNPWDIGSSRILVHLGFEALATTSAGFAFSTGRRDNTIARCDMVAHVAAIAAATDVPVSADLENGYGDDPETVAETIAHAAQVGIVGASIEDTSGRPDRPIHEHARAIERIRAAAEVAHALPFPFTLTARAENYLVGRKDIADTIKRLQLYQEAGADVLYAPGLTDRRDIAAVVRAVDRPVNVVMGLEGARFDVAELVALGVKRISVGSALSRAAYGALVRAAREIQRKGTFGFAEHALPFRGIGDIVSE